MLEARRAQSTSVCDSVLLYRAVFRNRIVLYAMVCLLFSILIQPIDHAYANTEGEVPEEVAEEPETESEVIADASDESNDDTATEAESESESSEVQTDVDQSDDPDLASDENQEETREQSTESEATDTVVVEDQQVEVDTDTATDTQVTSSQTDAAATSTEEDEETETVIETDIDGEVATATLQGASTSEPAVGDSGGSTTTDDRDTSGVTPATSTVSSTSTTTSTSTPAETDTASSTEDSIGETPVETNIEEEVTTDEKTKTVPQPDRDESDQVEEVIASSSASSTQVEAEAVQGIVYNKQSRYHFSESECVNVGEGAYYCSDVTTTVALSSTDVVAEADAEGDLEIFLITADNERVQLTSNQYDDAAPEYDQESDSVVWHRLIEGRYQIMLYDLQSGTETQLTDGSENSMEPNISGNEIVWQTWDGTDWEIVLLAGGDQTVLTDNTAHDVAPSIRDGYVMWHTLSDTSDKFLSVYEIETGVSSVIADPDGGQVENPRFVLVYDTTFDNGDTITKTYDPETGSIVAVGSEPAPMPAPELPDPEPTEETRALIQNKSSKEDSESDLLPDPSPTPEPPVSTSTDETTLDLARATSTETGAETDVTTASTTPTSEEVLPLSDYDLIVEPLAGSSSAQSTDTATTSNSVE